MAVGTARRCPSPRFVDDDDDDDKQKKTKWLSNDRSGHDDQNGYRIIKIGAILKGEMPFQSLMIKKQTN